MRDSTRVFKNQKPFLSSSTMLNPPFEINDRTLDMGLRSILECIAAVVFPMVYQNGR
jgi:hypothetical protein